MTRILRFEQPEATEPAKTGGKGANLARLTQADFRVPPGFCVTTDAYGEFLAASGLRAELAIRLGSLHYAEPSVLERESESLRALILAAPLPSSLAAEIAAAYAALGPEQYVAVRSSGTAEDLAGASFAGQHDTYLDVRGAPDVVAAVQRCWASLWTARALLYRHRNGFAHDAVAIAVVVQRMVQADVAGVLFTANPITTATDETVINATWGLGEALVQGDVTPDQFVVRMPDGLVLERTIGAKEHRIVRAHGRAGAGGVVREDVPAELRERACLDDAAIDSLARLGARVQTYYDGVPQDVEWAIERGELFLLQARPITGVEFTWDAEVDEAHTQAVPPDVVWHRAFSDALASGVVTPLTYSTRFPIFSGRNLRRFWRNLGHEDLAESRFFRYWKGELYYNSDAERLFVERLVPPDLRGMLLDFIPQGLHAATQAAPFDEAQLLQSVVRWYRNDPASTPTGFPHTFRRWRERSDYEGLSYAQLRELDDAALVAYCERMTEIFGQWNDDIYGPGTITMRLVMSGLRWMIAAWYDGGDPQAAFSKLVSGVTRRTDTQHENAALRALVADIRRSPPLRAALAASSGAEFFARAAELARGTPDSAVSREAREFLARYDEWIRAWGHRGHADRDYIYPRRSEDPAIDVRAFKLLLGADEAHDAEAAERAIAKERAATLARVLENVRGKPDGARKSAMIEALFDLAHDYLAIRDEERARPTDVLTFARKRGYVEIGRRLHERGLIDEARDCHFLAEQELFGLFLGDLARTPLLAAKIRARARACDRMLRREANMPMCMRRNRPIDLEKPPEASEPGVFPGTATSPGVVTGTARVVLEHAEMDRVGDGEILITHSTDPGWNPVFGMISGVVIETGGMLSHASCLAREYGFPAVHLPQAAKLIPDGARITVDGDRGIVRLLD